MNHRLQFLAAVVAAATLTSQGKGQVPVPAESAGPCTVSAAEGKAQASCGDAKVELGNATSTRSAYNAQKQSYMVIAEESGSRRVLLLKGGTATKKPELVDLTQRFTKGSSLPPNVFVDLSRYASEGVIRVWRRGGTAGE